MAAGVLGATLASERAAKSKIPSFSLDWSFDMPDDIILAESDPDVGERVDALRGEFNMVSIAKIVRDLRQAGMLLGVAFAEAPPSCEPLIGKVMLGYQNVLKDANESSHDIVMHILEGLTAHRDALESLEEGDTMGAIEDYRQSVAIAKKMEVISDALYQQSEALCSETDELIVPVLEQKAQSDTQRSQLRERVEELRANKERLTKLSDGLTEDVDAPKEGSLVEGPRLADSAQKIDRIHQLQREENARFTATLERLTIEAEDTFETKLETFDAVYTILTKVMIAFKYTELIWKGMQLDCNNLCEEKVEEWISQITK